MGQNFGSSLKIGLFMRFLMKKHRFFGVCEKWYSFDSRRGHQNSPKLSEKHSVSGIFLCFQLPKKPSFWGNIWGKPSIVKLFTFFQKVLVRKVCVGFVNLVSEVSHELVSGGIRNAALNAAVIERRPQVV